MGFFFGGGEDAKGCRRLRAAGMSEAVAIMVGDTYQMDKDDNGDNPDHKDHL